MGFIRRTWTLIYKNLLIVVLRNWFSTAVRALILPIAYTFFIPYLRNFFIPPSEYGFGSPSPIRDLATEVFGSSGSISGRDRVIFVNNGFTGGQIEAVIDDLSAPLRAAGVDVRILPDDTQLLEVCQSSLQGTTRCYGAASFYSSPTEGQGGIWNYTARQDGSLGQMVYVNGNDNDVQRFTLPFIHAIDSGIASASGTTLPDNILAEPFTYETRQDRDDLIQRFFMRALGRYLALVLYIGICGIAYHLPGHIASERELGMSQLIDAMTPDRRQWRSRTARILSSYLAFDLIYLPSWIGIGVILSALTFKRTCPAVTIIYNILAGFSLSSYSTLGGSFFRRAQLSGITVLVISLVVAIISQFIANSASAVIILSLLFPSANYTLFTIYLARFEERLEPANLSQGPPETSWDLPGYVFFILLVVQSLACLFLSTMVEWSRYGTNSKNRRLEFGQESTTAAVSVTELSKIYPPSWWRRKVVSGIFGRERESVRAVDGLTFSALTGQILVLLGANGSGKSTTLAAISGTGSLTNGTIEINGAGGLGLCPQKNVLWADLTVLEHVYIFNRLKSQSKLDPKSRLRGLVSACDLSHKAGKKSKTLSGGQKRKLQLAMAFTGGSRVCCIDEVTTGLDPLSRRKIWEILLSERGKRTFIFTTHALDEADALSDAIVILSKGKLRAQGSAIELKHQFGGGYRVNVQNAVNRLDPAKFGDVSCVTRYDEVVFEVENAVGAQRLVQQLEATGFNDYHVNGPSIEDVFLNVANDDEELLHSWPQKTLPGPEVKAAESKVTATQVLSDTDEDKPASPMAEGNGSGFFSQCWILFGKRMKILTRNYLPYLAATAVPVATAGLTIFFLTGFDGLTCSLSALANNPRTLSVSSLDAYWGLEIPVGPAARFSSSQLPQFYRTYADRFRGVDNFDGFQSFVRDNFRDVVPGGFYLGENATAAPVMAYRINGGTYYAALAKTVFDSVLMNATIISQISTFALPIASSTGDSLQLTLYFGFAMCAYPAFFALYPTFERRSNVRALHFSNGIRPAPLWLANLLFDGCFVLLISVVAIALFTGLSDLWYEPGYLFVVFFLYGLASTLMSYIISLFAKSQLGAFAFAAGGQAVLLLIYFILYLVLLTYSEPGQFFTNLNLVQYIYGLFTPSGNLLRALLLTLNQSQLLCRNQTYVAYAGDIEVYGGPILYLVIQIIVCYLFLVWYDPSWISTVVSRRWTRSTQADMEKDAKVRDKEVRAEIERTEQSNDGLRVLHLSKKFNKELAVDDVTFGVQHGEVFALLGPNGAGKSTTISLIRGDIKPHGRLGDVFIEGRSIKHDRLAARRFLGVCPQFDAMDRMTVVEHLRFYARICGVPQVDRNVNHVIEAVGLSRFRNRMAADLSGGNQRKLSLGIAIVGNPSILLLDEPSSGMDAIAKRVMWRVLSTAKTGRSLVITTHSMEEAGALADRAGIMAREMLAIGTTTSLRQQYGNACYVHLVLDDNAAGGGTEGGGSRIERWILDRIPGALIESNAMLHGQLRCVVPKTSLSSYSQPLQSNTKATQVSSTTSGSSSNSIAALLELFETHKEELAVRYYTVSQTTLEDVFLNIVGKHNIEEEEASKHNR